MCDTTEPLNRIHIEDIGRPDGFIVEEAAGALDLGFAECPSGQPGARSCSSSIARRRSPINSLPQWENNRGICYLFGISEQPLTEVEAASEWQLANKLSMIMLRLGNFEVVARVSKWPPNSIPWLMTIQIYCLLTPVVMVILLFCGQFVF